MTPVQVLQTYFGYSDFRPGQDAIISSVLANTPTLAVLPTGGGKSLCFQIPGLCLPGTTVVVSPLISLIQDQVATLRSKKISAIALTSQLNQREYAQTLTNITSNHYKFVYVSPERLLEPRFKAVCNNIQISLLAVDEAHCISIWGHEFRPAYTLINSFRKELCPRSKLIAVTATATSLVKNDICRQLNISGGTIFQKSSYRPNLKLHINAVSNHHQQIQSVLAIIKRHSGQSGIIYCLTRQAVKYWQSSLMYLCPDLPTAYYHGKMSATKRQQIQADFLSGKIKVIIATNAFGMGIDKPDIRYVIHTSVPLSLENYSQEIGRAGRDSKTSYCYLLHIPNQHSIQQAFISKSKLRSTLQKFEHMYAFAQHPGCLAQKLAEYFGDKISNCNHCSNCSPPTLNREISSYAAATQLIATKLGIPTYKVMTQSQLAWTSLLKPSTPHEFTKIPGIGHGWLAIYYQQFAQIQTWYNHSHDQKTFSHDHQGTSLRI